MGPISTGLGEIFLYTVDAAPGAAKPDGTPWTATDLRTLQDWVIRPQMRNTPGVTEVNTIGGFERQIHITPDPSKLVALGFTLQDLRAPEQLERMKLKRRLLDERKERELAAALQAGTPTVHDILDALVSPGRDPRADLPAPLTRQAIVKLSELKPGTILRGTVRNITDFGAFVDIGLHEDGLIHISELAKRRIKHPLEVVSIGQVLRVMVISVDEKRGRIGLSLKRVPEEVSV